MKNIILTILVFSIQLFGQYQPLIDVEQFSTLKPEFQSKLLSGLLLKNVIEKNKAYLRNEISREEAVENIIIYYEEKPTKEELDRLLQLGIKPYINTWTPPLKNHPFGFIIATMQTDKILSLL